MFGGAIDWAKGKFEKGKAWAKGKVEAGKQWASGKVESVRDRLTGKKGETEAPADAPGPPAPGSPEAEAKSEAIREEAGRRLLAASPELHDIDQTKAKAAEVGEELRPQGLKSISVEEREEGVYELMVEASNKEPVAVIRTQDEKGADVSLSSEVEFAEPPDVSGYKSEERGGKKFAQLVDPRESLRAGTLELPGPGETKIVSKTHSGKVLGKGSNQTHAEDLFTEWLMRDGKQLGRVVAVRAVLTGKFTPCPECVKSLFKLYNYLEKEHGTKVLDFDYSGVEVVYPGSKRGIQGWPSGALCLTAMTRAGWQVTPGAPMEPEEYERQKQLKFDARFAKKAKK